MLARSRARRARRQPRPRAVEPWLERAQRGAPARRSAPSSASRRATPRRCSRSLPTGPRPRASSVAYPGLWLRPDVYATHGHYLDCHLTVPTLERLGFGAMGRVMRRPARDVRRADDYEAVASPVFAWLDAIARQRRTGRRSQRGPPSRAWRALRRDAAVGAMAPAGTAAASARTPVAARSPGRSRSRVAALNRAGLGPLRATSPAASCAAPGLRAMGEVAARLRLGDAYVIFGHTHRAGPLPGDAAREWRIPGGARLVNCGCWIYDAYFLDRQPGESPYWPGCARARRGRRSAAAAAAARRPHPRAARPAPADGSPAALGAVAALAARRRG